MVKEAVGQTTMCQNRVGWGDSPSSQETEAPLRSTGGADARAGSQRYLFISFAGRLGNQCSNTPQFPRYSSPGDAANDDVRDGLCEGRRLLAQVTPARLCCGARPAAGQTRRHGRLHGVRQHRLCGPSLDWAYPNLTASCHSSPCPREVMAEATSTCKMCNGGENRCGADGQTDTAVAGLGGGTDGGGRGAGMVGKILSSHSNFRFGNCTCLQSWRYFWPIREAVRQQFSFSAQLVEASRSILRSARRRICRDRSRGFGPVLLTELYCAVSHVVSLRSLK